jgi:hypothetical protein
MRVRWSTTIKHRKWHCYNACVPGCQDQLCAMVWVKRAVAREQQPYHEVEYLIVNTRRIACIHLPRRGGFAYAKVFQALWQESMRFLCDM